jgi:hypothetical protein
VTTDSKLCTAADSSPPSTARALPLVRGCRGRMTGRR